MLCKLVCEIEIIHQGLIQNRNSILFFFQQRTKSNGCFYFLLLYIVIFLLYMQIDPFCAQIVLYTLSSNIHGAILSIHTMNILNIFFILFFFFPIQDATQGNIRFNRAGNQHSISYASNGKLNWPNDFNSNMSNQINIVHGSHIAVKLSNWILIFIAIVFDGACNHQR